ncbi:hypothetical protein JX265_012590 [Neoarthrinium moseri]|uniref:CHCH domain-containing protein n=1 Tax=Neoarthrinium moseri TaxID=1658444 RepID=A0A9Q0AII0_9PEZI|nr:hypothetical protein JX266_011211 [Neoarthrinium moseri]KAI1853905.1 hypothetical protein JX265_012590 [Neoarthrinium moseri]
MRKRWAAAAAAVVWSGLKLAEAQASRASEMSGLRWDLSSVASGGSGASGFQVAILPRSTASWHRMAGSEVGGKGSLPRMWLVWWPTCVAVAGSNQRPPFPTFRPRLLLGLADIKRSFTNDKRRRTTNEEAVSTTTMAARKPIFNQQVLVDTTPLPDSIPKVPEVGATSAPLLSASFFIGARCRPYNDDFMQCKNENPGKGEAECLKEGRRVTRCAASVIDDVNKHCLDEFRKHWQCLDNNNHQLWQCRKDEWKLNKCVFDNLKLEKELPDAVGIPVHLRSKQIYAHYPILRDPGQKPFPKAVDPPSAPAS